jgi:hypothetical protein
MQKGLSLFMLLFLTAFSVIISINNTITFNSPLSLALAQNESQEDSNNQNSATASTDISSSVYNIHNIPTAKSVYDTGTMTLPSSVKGFIVALPDETHHLAADNKTMSSKNPHYIPNNIVIPSGTMVAFIHGDPHHVHSEIIKDSNNIGNVVWQTIPVNHPGFSDVKALPSGSYSISDPKYPPMQGTIVVSNSVRSNGDMTVGAFFCPTSSISRYKADLSNAGFQVLSTYDFISKTSQKSISGPTTLIIYSTTLPIQTALTKLVPEIGLLPYG